MIISFNHINTLTFLFPLRLLTFISMLQIFFFKFCLVSVLRTEISVRYINFVISSNKSLNVIDDLSFLCDNIFFKTSLVFITLNKTKNRIWAYK